MITSRQLALRSIEFMIVEPSPRCNDLIESLTITKFTPDEFMVEYMILNPTWIVHILQFNICLVVLLTIRIFWQLSIFLHITAIQTFHFIFRHLHSTAPAYDLILGHVIFHVLHFLITKIEDVFIIVNLA